MSESTTPTFRFPRTHRLRKQREFDLVYQAATARSAGPLRVFGRPNNLDHCRLGLNVSRRVGHAVRRNRVKRMVRESFRLLQHELPGGYDLVVVARPHQRLALEDYQRLLRDATARLHHHWQKVQADAT